MKEGNDIIEVGQLSEAEKALHDWVSLIIYDWLMGKVWCRAQRCFFEREGVRSKLLLEHNTEKSID